MTLNVADEVRAWDGRPAISLAQEYVAAVFDGAVETANYLHAGSVSEYRKLVRDNFEAGVKSSDPVIAQAAKKALLSLTAE